LHYRPHPLTWSSPIPAAYIGYLAGALTVASYLPQVVRAWRTKETKDLSYGMFGMLVTAAALWIAYGLLSDQWPVIATNVGCGVLNVAILAAKIRYR
jgi:MtN3 and saliva related transmembrane protein